MKTCKTCGSPLKIRKTKRSSHRLKKPYYYTAYYWCPNCKKLYHDDKFKVTNNVRHPERSEGSPSLFEKDSSPRQRRAQNDKEDFDVEIWTDGACVYNGTDQARAAWAFVSGKYEKRGLIEGKQTNNRAEAFAMYHALVWAASKGYKRIRLHSDSQITLHGVLKHPKKVKQNRDIFQKIYDVVTENKLTIDYQKVLGHSGDVNNERVDKLANILASSPNLTQQ